MKFFIKSINPDLLSACALCFLLLAPGYCPAEITVKKFQGVEKPIATALISGVACVSIADLAKALGLTIHEDSLSRKLRCSHGGARIVFSEDVPFYCSHDTVRQLPCAPLTHEGKLFLPAWVCGVVFGELGHESVVWNPADSCFSMVADSARRRLGQTLLTPGIKTKQADSEGQSNVSNSQQIIKTIVLDPGHGGKDPGAIGPDGIQEKDVVLSVALQLREALKKKAPDRLYDAG